MKKYSIIVLAVLVCIVQFPVRALEQRVLPVALCCGEDAYSVDLVYTVSSEPDVLSVEFSVEDCLYDWNYISQDKKLYIAVASFDAIPKDRDIIHIYIDAGVALTLESVCVNGNVTENVYTSHTEEIDKAQDATCTSTGFTEGKHCSVCGEILIEQEEVPAMGHSFGEWVTIQEATSGENGLQERECVCGEKESRVTAVRSIAGQFQVEGSSAMPTVVKLMQNGTLIARTEITGNMYSFSGVFTGIYDLIIERENHLPYTIVGVPVETADVDLTKHPVNAIANAVLVAGDINSDGCIDLQDVALLTSSNTYSRPYDEAANKSADVNGDHHFDLQDLAIITSEKNYGKEAITVSFGEIAD